MIRCNNCMKELTENDLIKETDPENGEIIDACPNCLTDHYLIDLEGKK